MRTFYDPDFGAYVLCQENALGQEVQYRYYGVSGGNRVGADGASCNPASGSGIDAANGRVFGALEEEKDANGAITSYSYDRWQRLVGVWRPGESKAAGHGASERVVYPAFTGGAGGGYAAPFVVRSGRRDDAGGGASASYLESWRVYDGLGQAIQSQAEAETGGQRNVVDVWYDGQGRRVKESIAYAAAAAGDVYINPQAQPHIDYAYDELGRTTTITNTDLTVTRSFYSAVAGGERTAVIDANQHQTIQEMDGFGRLRWSRQYEGSFGTGPVWIAPVYAEAAYSYDEFDRLVGVTGPGNAPTSLVYDALGRKTSLSDPDMGAWSYGYDAVGNLTRQTDARNQRTCFYYDALNRLKGKTYSSGAAACPADPGYAGYAVSYYFDETTGGNKGVGRRTGMVVYSGGAVSNSAAWVYDARGRVTSETRKVEVAGVLQATVTAWTYDAADRMTSMTYPDGEIVSTTYTPQGLPDSLGSYVTDTTYDASGRALVRMLGANLRSESVYYAWGDVNGQGRLKQAKAGTGSSPSSLLMLSYTYDAEGNVRTIIDAKNASQQQCFTYDELDRLKQGYTGNSGCTTYASAGNGPFEEQYSYFPNGNLDHKKVVQPTYQDDAYLYDAPVSGCATGTLATKPHAVRQAGSNTYSYDCNGNMLGRPGQSLAYDPENHMIGVSGSVVASFVYDGDGLRVKATFGSGDGASIASFSGKHFEVDSLYRESFDDGLAQNWQVNSGTWVVQSGGYRQSNTTLPNSNVYYNLLQNQPQVVQWKATYTIGTQAGLYFYASSAAASDAERGNSYRVWQDGTTVKIYESANNVVTQRASFAAANAAGQTHSYQAMYNPQNGKLQVWRDGSYLGSWTDSTPLSTGNYLSLRTSNSNVLFDEVMVGKVKKYYYQGGVRVAMRDGTSVYYLFGDHLGSTNVTTDNGSTLVARLLYKPFGQVRYNTNNQKTDYRYTGQWWASGGGATLGLYDYNARWYDPSLARFVQADTIVPQPGNPGSLNRYAYVMNNPLRYTDPTGHAECASEDCVVRVHPKTKKPLGLRQKWGIVMVGPWEADKAWMVYEGMNSMSDRAGAQLGDAQQGDRWVRTALGGTELVRWPNKQMPPHLILLLTGIHTLLSKLAGKETPWQGGPTGLALPAHDPLFDSDADTIYFFDKMDETTPVHESGHIIDYRNDYVSSDMAKVVNRKRSPTSYGTTNPIEDFAESWKYWVYNESGLTIDRQTFIESLVVQWR